MGLMLAFPEYIVGISTTNLFGSWVNTPHLKNWAEIDGVPWSLTHTIPANMGGIALRFVEPRNQGGSQKQSQQTPNSNDLNEPGDAAVDIEQVLESPVGDLVNNPDTEAACYNPPRAVKIKKNNVTSPPPTYQDVPDFIQDFQKNQERHLRALGDIPWTPYRPHLALAADAEIETQGIWRSVKTYKAKHIAPLHGNIWVLDSKQLGLARQFGIIGKLPSLEVEEINDKSKSDGLIRLLAVIQVIWLAIQLIVRQIDNTFSSALEISTMAFATCAAIIYIAEWPKPKDVNVPYYIDTSAVVSPDIFSQIAEAAPISFLQARHYYMPMSAIHQVVEGRYQKKHVDRLMVWTSIASITLFGGIHLFAWNFPFPGYIEKVIWRVSALLVSIAPTISALLVLLESVTSHRTDKMATWSVGLLAPFYLAARAFIIVESFRSLYFLPPQAFIATWVSNSPHVG